MYVYKHVDVVVEKMGPFSSKPNYKELIKEYAANGWRLIQIIENEHDLVGRALSYEAIFEKQIEELQEQQIERTEQ